MAEIVGTCPVDVGRLLRDRPEGASVTIGLWSQNRTATMREVVDHLTRSLAMQTQTHVALIRIEEPHAAMKSDSMWRSLVPLRSRSFHDRVSPIGKEQSRCRQKLSVSVFAPSGAEETAEGLEDASRLPFLKRRFHSIVIDLCGCSSSTAESMGRLCSLVSLIVEPSKDGVKHTRASVERLKQAGVRLGGFWTLSAASSTASDSISA